MPQGIAASITSTAFNSGIIGSLAAAAMNPNGRTNCRNVHAVNTTL